MIKEGIQIFYKRSYIFIIFIVIINIYTVTAQADLFLKPLEIFIRDGKQYTVIIREGINQIVFSPETDTYLYGDTRNNETNRTFSLRKSENYIIRTAERRSHYLLQVFATGNSERAAAVCQELLDKGYENAYIEKEDGLYKVRIGGYSAEEEVRDVKVRLENDGWNTWLISRIDETSPQLVLTDLKGEELFSGQEFLIRGEIVINGERYPGSSRFLLTDKGICILNQVKLNDLLAGLMSSFDDNDNNYQELLKARAVALRTGLLYLVYEKNIFKEDDYFSLPEYKGIGGVTAGIWQAISDTEGIILSSSNFLAGIDLKELINNEINNRVSQEHSFELILKKRYPQYSLLDLKTRIEEQLVVNAEVEWGLRYKEFRQLTWWGPRVITLLDLDLTRKGFVIEPVLAGQTKRGLADLSKMVAREGALAGVNGGYFASDGNPLGLIIKEGEVISEPIKNRTALLITPEGEVAISPIDWKGLLRGKDKGQTLEITGVNRKPAANEAVVINKYYGEKAPELKEGILELVINQGKIVSVSDGRKGGSTPLPPEGFIIQIHGEKIAAGLSYQIGERVVYEDVFQLETPITQIDRALGAGPRLIEKGQIKITSQEEGFQPDIAWGRAPRSAVGITADQHLVIVTVDGRQPELSIGMSLQELAEWMLNYGVVEGMNLDGGYSARMVVRGFTMNNPGQERLVNNGLLIFKK